MKVKEKVPTLGRNGWHCPYCHSILDVHHTGEAYCRHAGCKMATIEGRPGGQMFKVTPPARR